MLRVVRDAGGHRVSSIPPGSTAWRGPDPFSMRQKLELVRAARCGAAGPDRGSARRGMSWRGSHSGSFVDQLLAGSVVHAPARIRVGANLAGREPGAVVGAAPPAAPKPRGDSGERQRCGIPACWQSPSADAHLIDAGADAVRPLAAAGVRHFATEQLVEAGSSSSRTGRLEPAEPGLFITGAISRATTPKSPAVWLTRSSRGCRSRKPRRCTARSDRIGRGSSRVKTAKAGSIDRCDKVRQTQSRQSSRSRTRKPFQPRNTRG